MNSSKKLDDMPSRFYQIYIISSLGKRNPVFFNDGYYVYRYYYLILLTSEEWNTISSWHELNSGRNGNT